MPRGEICQKQRAHRSCRAVVFNLLTVVLGLSLAAQAYASPLPAPQPDETKSVTVPFILDHNRMLVDAEIQRADGTWRAACLWVDTGAPSFFMSESLARDLGADLSAIGYDSEVALPGGVRIGGMQLDFHGVESRVSRGQSWQFNAMHNDGNLPSMVLKRYDVVFDYPGRRLTIAAPGSLRHRGVRAPAAVNPKTGIVQIDAVIDGDSLSFALDNGASYSFVDSVVVGRLAQRHPDWPCLTGAIGCANMWGWWPPDEQILPVMRLPEIMWGPVRLAGVGVVGVPAVAPGGPPLGAWYSRKAARSVNGFLGPNAFKAFRVEIDYAGRAVYFERRADFDLHDMDLVGLTLRPESDGSYTVIGIAMKDGKPAVEGVDTGDKLLEVGDLKATGATMGTVVDALRGVPGDIRTLVLERNGKRFRVVAEVMHLLDVAACRLNAPSQANASTSADLEKYYGDAPRATLAIEDQKQIAALSSSSWPKRKIGHGVLQVNADASATVTPSRPLTAHSPFTAVLTLPIPVEPMSLGYRIAPVTVEDREDTLSGNQIRWNIPARYLEGRLIPLLLKQNQSIELSLEPGTYVLEIFSTWSGLGDAEYGYYIDVQQ